MPLLGREPSALADKKGHQSATVEAGRGERRPYRAPHFRRYGSVAELTGNLGGAGNDGEGGGSTA